MRVLIIPEDPTLDQHVVKPVVQRIFSDLGRTARVDVLTDPHRQGMQQVCPEIRTLKESIQRWIEEHPS